MDCSPQAPLSLGFSRPDTRVQIPSPGDLPNPGIEPRPPALQVDSLMSDPPGNPINGTDGESKVLSNEVIFLHLITVPQELRPSSLLIIMVHVSALSVCISALSQCVVVQYNSVH